MAAIPASKRTPVKSEPLKPFMNVVNSEWTKLITARSNHMLLLLAAVLSMGVAALFAWGAGVSWSEWTDADRAAFDPVQSSMLGIFFSGIVSIVISANAVTNEYASGMIRQTFTVTPRRIQVVLARMLVVSAYLLIPGFVFTFGSMWIAQIIMGNYGMPTADLFGSDFPPIFWLSLSGIYYPILTIAIAFLMKSSAATLSTVMVTTFFPAMFGGLFPRAIQERVLALLPGNAIDALTLGHLSPDYPQYLDRPLAALVAAVWLVGLTGLAIWNLNRRDVG